MAGLWDMYQGYGESLEDMGGGRNGFGFGSLDKTANFDQYFRGLNQVGLPGPIKPAFQPFGNSGRQHPLLLKILINALRSRMGR